MTGQPDIMASATGKPKPSYLLGNTKAICRKCYVHPTIIDSYLDRSLVSMLKRRTESTLRTSLPALSPEEAAVLALLQQRMEKSQFERVGPGKRRGSSDAPTRRNAGGNAGRRSPRRA